MSRRFGTTGIGRKTRIRMSVSPSRYPRHLLSIPAPNRAGITFSQIRYAAEKERWFCCFSPCAPASTIASPLFLLLFIYKMFFRPMAGRQWDNSTGAGSRYPIVVFTS